MDLTIKNKIKSLIVAVLISSGIGCQQSDEEINDSQSPPSSSGSSNDLSYSQADELIQGQWYHYKFELYDKYCSNGEEFLVLQESKNMSNTGYSFNFTNEPIAPYFNNLFSDGHGSSWRLEGGGGDYDCAYMFYNYNPVIDLPAHSLTIQSPDDLYIHFRSINNTNGNSEIGESTYGWFTQGGKVEELTTESFVLSLQRISTNQTAKVYFRRQPTQDATPNGLNLSGTFQLVEKKEIANGIESNLETSANGDIFQFTTEVLSQAGGFVSANELMRIKLFKSNQTANYSLTIENYTNNTGYWSATDTHLMLNGVRYKVEALTNQIMILRKYTSCNTYKEYKLNRI
jgi:hypothetical protein